MKHVDLTRLPEFLKSRRWFGGKAWPIKSVSILDHVDLETPSGSTFAIGVVDVHYELGNPELYVVPVRAGEGGAIQEALEDDELARRLLRVLRECSEVQTGSGVLRAECLPPSREALASLKPSPTVRRLSVEQTNTSIVFDDQVILKIIRRVEPGLSPEIEVGRHLSEVGFKNTPALLGYLKMDGPADATLAVLHRFVQAEGDGWAYFQSAFKTHKHLPDSFVADARQLGARTAELHLAMAASSSVPGFEPEPIGKEDLQRWSSSLIGELGVTLSQASAQFPELEKRRDALVERAQRLAHVEPSGLKIRTHGDFHLGQVLRVNGDWQIFDFEGEPTRPYAGRREKQSALRDVAGMLRSFGYVTAAAAKEGAVEPGRYRKVRQAYLDGYLERAKGAAFLPTSREALLQVLDALELEKVLYELRYEIHHRPSWASIPAHTLLDVEG